VATSQDTLRILSTTRIARRRARSLGAQENSL